MVAQSRRQLPQSFFVLGGRPRAPDWLGGIPRPDLPTNASRGCYGWGARIGRMIRVVPPLLRQVRPALRRAPSQAHHATGRRPSLAPGGFGAKVSRWWSPPAPKPLHQPGATIAWSLPVPATRALVSSPGPTGAGGLVYSSQLQATHCREAPAWTGRWFSPRGDRWFRVWACPEHLEGQTGLRQFGSGSRTG